MKNITLIILCFFGLNIMAQTTVVIEAKDNKDTKAISEVKKNQSIVITVDGKPVDAKITKIVTDPNQEDIRELTPQLAKSVADLKQSLKGVTSVLDQTDIAKGVALELVDRSLETMEEGYPVDNKPSSSNSNGNKI